MASLLSWGKKLYEAVTPQNEEAQRIANANLQRANEQITSAQLNGTPFRYGKLAQQPARQQLIQQNQAPKLNLVQASRSALADTFTKPQVWQQNPVNIGSFKGSGLLEDFINSPFKVGQGIARVGSGDVGGGLGQVTAGLIEGPAGLIPVGKAAQAGAQGTKLLPKVLAGARVGAKEGAVYGGLYGAGQSASQNQSLKDIAKAGLLGTTIGGAGGAVLGGGIPLAAAGAKQLPKAVAGLDNLALSTPETRIGLRDQNVLRDFSDMLVGANKAKGRELSDLITRARAIGQKNGVDLINGSNVERLERTNSILDNIGKSREAVKQGGYLKVPGVKATQPKVETPKDVPTVVKEDFMGATNDYLGTKQAAQSQNVALVRQLPKLNSNESLGLIDSIQQGATNGRFDNVSGDIRRLLDSKYAELQAAGVDLGYLQDYFPQQWKNASADEVNNAFQILNQRAGFQNPRVIPTVQEGISLGYQPKHTDYRQVLNEYLTSADQLIANRKYFDTLKAQGLVMESAQKPKGMQIVEAPGIPQARSILDQELGVEVQQNYYATPEVARNLNKLFSPDIRDAGGKVAKVTGNVSSAMQTLFLSGGLPGTPLNAFGAAQWQKQALSGRPISATKSFFRAFSEKKTAAYEAKNLDLIQKMEKAGVPYRGTLDEKALSTVAERIAEQSGVGKAKAAILEGWSKAVEDPTFRRYLPLMQLDTFKSTYGRLIKNGVPEGKAVKQAADATRNAFGLTSLAKEALKNKTAKDVTKSLFFAPKFRESMINFWANNAKSLGSPTNPAYRENVKFLANATILFGAMQAANMALNEGKTTFQNSNPNDRLNLSIPRGEDGKAITVPFLSSIATVPRIAVNSAVDLGTGQFKEAGLEGKKLLSQLVRPPLDLLGNEKYNGREVYDPEDPAGKRVKDAALYTVGQYNHPYVSAGINAATGKSSGTAETVASAIELPLRFRNYESTTSQAKNSTSNTEKKDIKAGTGISIQKLSNGKYAYTLDGDTTVHEAKTLSDAREAVAKAAFKDEEGSYRVVGNKVYRKNSDGDVTTITKDSFDYQIGTANLTAQKRAGNLEGWLETAQSQLGLIDKQLRDPSIDPLEKAKLENQADALLENMDKYLGYGGFTRGGGGSRGGTPTASFKTASGVKAPNTPEITVRSPGSFRAPAVKKLAVKKMTSSASKRRLA